MSLLFYSEESLLKLELSSEESLDVESSSEYSSKIMIDLVDIIYTNNLRCISNVTKIWLF